MNGTQRHNPLENALRDEVERTRADLAGKLGQAERALLPLAAGGLVVLFGLQLVFLAGVVLLARVMPLWLAALLLGFSAVVLGALIMALAAKRALMRLPAEPNARDRARESGSRAA